MAYDQYYNSVSLLLHCDGTNGSTTFTDNSPSPKTVTANGNAQISTAQSKWGGAAGAFDGTGDYIGYDATTDRLIGPITESSPATIEFWAYRVSGSTIGLFDSGSGVVSVIRNYPADTIEIQGTGQSAAFTLPLTTWTHVAIVLTKSGSVISAQIFKSGVSQGTLAAALSDVGEGFFGFGAVNGSICFNGYIDDIRITKGVARYTADFTPPTEAFPNSYGISLGGISASGSIGTILLSRTQDFSGSEIASNGGAVIAAYQYVADGSVTTISQGSTASSQEISMPGVESALLLGTFREVLSGIWFDVTGIEFSTAVGTITGDTSAPVIGTQSGLQYGVFGIFSESFVDITGSAISLIESQFGVATSISTTGISAASVFGPLTFVKFAALSGRQIQISKENPVGHTLYGLSGNPISLYKETVWPAIGLKSAAAVSTFGGSVFKSGNLVLAGAAVVADFGISNPKMSFSVTGAQASTDTGNFQHSADKALTGKLSAVSLNPVDFSSSDIFSPLVGQSMLFAKGEIYIGADEWYNYIRVYAVDSAQGVTTGSPVIVLLDEHQSITTLQLS